MLDSRRKAQFNPSPKLPDICRMTTIKVLWSHHNNHLSVSDQVRDAIFSAPTLCMH